MKPLLAAAVAAFTTAHRRRSAAERAARELDAALALLPMGQWAEYAKYTNAIRNGEEAKP
ncbi:hypothetical protein LCGC14_1103830 [marine sediment metagenome]|uniref:Uncharacterized protein n=1 Tax=marine sediment metagenome TaxID=412755 RepID=A0A0F9M8S2_9ZZZZ